MNNQEALNQITEELSAKAEENPSVKVLREVQETNKPLDVTNNNVLAQVVPAEETLNTKNDYYFKAGDMSPDDIFKLTELNKRIKSGEKFSAYRELPEAFKRFIDHEVKTHGIGRKGVEMLTRASIEAAINEAEIDKEYNKFKAEINNAFNGKEFIDAIFETEDATISGFLKLLEQAKERYKESGNEADEKQIKHYEQLYQTAISAQNYVSEFKKYIDANPSILYRLRDGGRFIKRANRFFEDIDFDFNKANIKIAKMQDVVKRSLFIGFTELDFTRFLIMTKLIADTKETHCKILYLYYAITHIYNLTRSGSNISDLDKESRASMIFESFKEAMKNLTEAIEKEQYV